MKKLTEQEMKAEVEIEQIDDVGDTADEALTADVIHDIGDIADDIYEIVFEKGAKNVSADAAGKITQAHELLFDALETLDKEESTSDAVTRSTENVVTEAKKIKTEKEEKKEEQEQAYDDRKTIERMRNLSMLGLIDRAAVPHLVRLIKDMHASKNITTPQRRLALGLLNGLIDIVTGDIVFNAARREIVKQGLDKSDNNG